MAASHDLGLKVDHHMALPRKSLPDVTVDADFDNGVGVGDDGMKGRPVAVPHADAFLRDTQSCCAERRDLDDELPDDGDEQHQLQKINEIRKLGQESSGIVHDRKHCKSCIDRTAQVAEPRMPRRFNRPVRDADAGKQHREGAGYLVLGKDGQAHRDAALLVAVAGDVHRKREDPAELGQQVLAHVHKVDLAVDELEFAPGHQPAPDGNDALVALHLKAAVAHDIPEE